MPKKTSHDVRPPAKVKKNITDESNRIIRGTFIASVSAFVLSSLTTSIGSLIDGVVIGKYLGMDSLEAFSLVSPVLIVFSLIGAVIASGARNRFTTMMGSGDISGARGVFTLSAALGAGLPTLLLIVILLFSDPVCTLLGATGSAAGLLDKTRGYLVGVAIGLPAMNLSRILSVYMAIDNDRLLPVISSLVLTVADIALDVIIAASGGGTFGMGLATSISHYAALVVLLMHFRRGERLLRFTPSAIRWKEAFTMIFKGLPVGIGRLSNTMRTIALNHALAWAAVTGCIAAYGVQRQADSLLNPFIFGISDAISTLTGILSGEENRHMLRWLAKDCFLLVCTFILALSALFWFLSPPFAALFFDGAPEALELAVRAARCFAVGLPVCVLCHAYEGYLEGRGKTHRNMVLTFLSEGGYIVLAAFALQPFMGAEAVWYAFPVSQVLLLVTIFVLILIQNRREKAQPKDVWEWVLGLPADFDVPECDRIDRTITDRDGVMDLSRDAWDFCERHGCDPRRKYFISLAVEELATNTVTYGFRPGRHNCIDMRILKKKDEYILRIRDNCEIFDPVKQLQLYSADSPVHHIGLRLAMSSARDVQYTTILKLNNLVLRI